MAKLGNMHISELTNDSPEIHSQEDRFIKFIQNVKNLLSQNIQNMVSYKNYCSSENH